MKTTLRLTALPLMLSLTACPPPDASGTVACTNVSDALNDPRAAAYNLGGLDPGAGLPEPGLGACRRIEENLHSEKARDRFELSLDSAQRAVELVRFFDQRPDGEDREIAHTSYSYDGQSRLVGVDNEYQGIVDETAFFHDSAGRLQRAVATDEWDEVTTFDYTWDPTGRLEKMEAKLELDGETVVSQWSIDYKSDDAGRLARKRLKHSGQTSLEVEYVYDGRGRLTTKTYRGTREIAEPVVDLYTWENDRLVTIERPVAGQIARHTYDDTGRLTDIERTVRKTETAGNVERVESVVRFEYDCGPTMIGANGI